MHKFEDNQKTFISLQICIIIREIHVRKYFYIQRSADHFYIFKFTTLITCQNAFKNLQDRDFQKIDLGTVRKFPNASFKYVIARLITHIWPRTTFIINFSEYM